MSARRRAQDLQALHRRGSSPARSPGARYVVDDAKGRFVANAALASRKDARDAVLAARKAFGGWSGRTAYNRGQILYRVAEILEGRRAAVRARPCASPRGSRRQGRARCVDAAIDRLVWYAGWADKIAQVVGGANPVAGPFFNLSTPEPTGVVAVLAPAGVVACSGWSASSPRRSSPATRRSWCSSVRAAAARRDASPRCSPPPTCPAAWSTSSPAGSPNRPCWPRHMDVNAIDLTGVAGDATQAPTLEDAAADNLKRVLRAPAAEPDWTLDPASTG